MDDREKRAAHRRRIAAMLHILEERGGDELAVIESQVDGFVMGLETHGAMDLEKPRDWRREIDMERRDISNYEASWRLSDIRALSNAIAGGLEDDAAIEITVDMGSEITSLAFEDLLDVPTCVSDPIGDDEEPRLRARGGRR